MSIDLSSRSVLLFGSDGPLRAALREGLERRGCTEITGLTLDEDTDLAELSEVDPGLVIHLPPIWGATRESAASVDSFNQALREAGQAADLAASATDAKLVVIGTIDAYPKLAPVPWREEDLWSGPPEPRLSLQGVATRAIQTLLNGYRAEYGLSSALVLPIAIYGPGESFGGVEGADLIPDLISTFTDAAESWEREVVCEGSGSPTRDFLYVDDAVEAILLAAERVDDVAPLNIGVGRETSLRQVTELVAQLVGYRGQIRWDKTRPDGTARRLVDTARARRLLGWEASTPLRTGLKKTISWWRSERVGSRTEAAREA